jgi:class 3 adenylate cyclase/tetratricopeptide (TPR) repeat protein
MERRVCSILFVDLVGFTPLSEARDPEEVRELLSQYFEAAKTIIGRYGGVVEKFIGDAVMAVWGAPVAAEGDAERAVRAGLDIIDAVAALGAEMGTTRLAARAGVVTGEVAAVLHRVGEGMVAGDAVNTAARVQSVADAGSLLVDATTRRLADQAIAFADAGDHTLKGKAEPVRLWRAARVLAMVGGAQRVDGLEAPLIGRDAEMRLLKEQFHAVADRRMPRLVVVTGPAGIGKSRLGWEFEKYIDGLAQFYMWHRGRCLSYGEGVAFWALAEAVRQRLSIAEEDPTDVAAEKLVAGLRDIVADPADRDYVAVRVGRLLGLPVAGDPGAPLSREELFAGWRMFFENLAAECPVIWLIEDAQHADAGLLDFVDYLVDWARDLPIFLLVFSRPELEERRRGFGVGRNRTTLAIDPLSGDAMDALVDALVPGMDAAARGAVTAHAEGVPLFAVETVRSLIDRDVVVPVEGVYRLVGQVGELSVPDSLHGLLAARLDALDPTVRSLVAEAAVLGASFPAEALLAISDQPEEDVRGGLTDLVRREVLEVSADRLSPQRGAYRFTHNMLRQVAYDTLSRRDRKSHHIAVAEHLRHTFSDDGEEVANVIASHYLDALSAVPDDVDVGALRRQAIEMLAPAAAAASLRSAAQLAEAAGDERAASFWEQVAENDNIAAAYVSSIEAAERAAELYQVAGLTRSAARAHVIAAFSLSRAGHHTDARAGLVAALEVLRPDPDRDTVAALGRLGGLEAVAGSSDADAVTAEGLVLGQAMGVDDALMAQLLGNRGIAHIIAGRAAQAAAYQREAARLAERGGDAHGQGRALTNLADVLAGFDPRGAMEPARGALDLGRRCGSRHMMGISVSNLVDIQLLTGEWGEADATLQQAAEDGLDDFEFVEALCGLVLALKGDVSAAETFAARLTGMRASEDPQDRTTVAWIDAEIAAGAGYAKRALELAQTVVQDLDITGLSAMQIRWTWPLAVRNAFVLGDRSAVMALVALLDAQPAGHMPPLLRAIRDLATARLATDPAVAGPLFEAGVATLRQIPAPYHLAHALIDFSANLQATGQPGRAKQVVQEAKEIAERLGAEPLLARAQAADAVTV